MTNGIKAVEKVKTKEKMSMMAKKMSSQDREDHATNKMLKHTKSKSIGLRNTAKYLN